jgi:hypothetical protein
LFGLVLTACGSDPVKLADVPKPLPPTVVEVPVYVSLPPERTQPCPEPQRRPVNTDVDLFNAADAWKVTARCNAAKLRAIGP